MALQYCNIFNNFLEFNDCAIFIIIIISDLGEWYTFRKAILPLSFLPPLSLDYSYRKDYTTQGAKYFFSLRSSRIYYGKQTGSCKNCFFRK